MGHRNNVESGAFPLIDHYAFLSDCQTNALIAPSGNVEWLCLPRGDSPAVFLAVLDRGAGRFRVGPADAIVPAGRRYLPGTLVLETTWQTPTGWLIIRDALVIGPWRHWNARSNVWRRAPTDDEAEHMLLRTIRCVQGEVLISLECEPTPQYGLKSCSWAYVGDDYRAVETAVQGEDGELSLRLGANLNLGIEGGTVTARKALVQGDEAFVALSWSDDTLPDDCADAYGQMTTTGNFWRKWLNSGQFPDHPWREFLQRSALTLKGLTYAPTGAFLAAATTSLPETPGGERNWDYRYTWIRDTTFALWGLYTLGLSREANDFFFFLADACGGGEDLQVVYGADGRRTLDESVLGHLSGYGGAKPVRIGNDAYRQRQHDVWGAAIDSVYIHTKSRDTLPEALWPVVQRQVEKAIAHWREPDCGIWEVRGEPQHFTSSKLMCWVALDRGARLARLRGDADPVAARWQGVADEIHAEICDRGMDDRGVFVQSYGSTALDASLLLMPLVRFLPPDDNRIRQTVLAIEKELTVDGLVLRYRVEETDDGMRGEEGSFTICSFWLVSALAAIGEVERARQLCEKLLSFASPLGLYAEEIDPLTGRHLGNFPQAFTHLALINALVHVIRAGAGEKADRLAIARPER
jgi:GH15 family glucan-1,4-alpha-glucosidase